MIKFGAVGGFELPLMLLLLLLMLLPLFLFWRVFGKTGMPPALALVCLVPGVGHLLALLVLAFSRWPAVEPELASLEPPSVMS